MRAVQITEFGGSKHFTPALEPSTECDHNCSFVAGDPSLGFVLLAFAIVLKRRRSRAAGWSIAIGTLIGLMRIAQGGHFLSDVIFCGILVCGVVLILDQVISVRHAPGCSDNCPELC